MNFFYIIDWERQVTQLHYQVVLNLKERTEQKKMNVLIK